MKTKLIKCPFCWEYFEKLCIYKSEECCEDCKALFEMEDASKEVNAAEYIEDDESIH